MKSVLKLPVCHFSYVNLVTEGALIIFFPEKKRQGALIGAGGAKWGEYGNLISALFKSRISNAKVNKVSLPANVHFEPSHDSGQFLDGSVSRYSILSE